MSSIITHCYPECFVMAGVQMLSSRKRGTTKSLLDSLRGNDNLRRNLTFYEVVNFKCKEKMRGRNSWDKIVGNSGRNSPQCYVTGIPSEYRCNYLDSCLPEKYLFPPNSSLPGSVICSSHIPVSKSRSWNGRNNPLYCMELISRI
jgi:hypothetical protein